MEKDRNWEPGKGRVITKAEIEAYIRNKEEGGDHRLLTMDEDTERLIQHIISIFPD